LENHVSGLQRRIAAKVEGTSGGKIVKLSADFTDPRRFFFICENPRHLRIKNATICLVKKTAVVPPLYTHEMGFCPVPAEFQGFLGQNGLARAMLFVFPKLPHLHRIHQRARQ